MLRVELESAQKEAARWKKSADASNVNLSKFSSKVRQATRVHGADFFEKVASTRS